MYDYSNKSNEKQRLKSKKQIQHGVRIGSSLLHPQTAGRVGEGYGLNCVPAKVLKSSQYL